jgi:hypothetical protein
VANFPQSPPTVRCMTAITAEGTEPTRSASVIFPGVRTRNLLRTDVEAHSWRGGQSVLCPPARVVVDVLRLLLRGSPCCARRAAIAGFATLVSRTASYGVWRCSVHVSVPLARSSVIMLVLPEHVHCPDSGSSSMKVSAVPAWYVSPPDSGVSLNVPAVPGPLVAANV